MASNRRRSWQGQRLPQTSERTEWRAEKHNLGHSGGAASQAHWPPATRSMHDWFWLKECNASRESLIVDMIAIKTYIFNRRCKSRDFSDMVFQTHQFENSWYVVTEVASDCIETRLLVPFLWQPATLTNSWRVLTNSAGIWVSFQRLASAQRDASPKSTWWDKKDFVAGCCYDVRRTVNDGHHTSWDSSLIDTLAVKHVLSGRPTGSGWSLNGGYLIPSFLENPVISVAIEGMPIFWLLFFQFVVLRS